MFCLLQAIGRVIAPLGNRKPARARLVTPYTRRRIVDPLNSPNQTLRFLGRAIPPGAAFFRRKQLGTSQRLTADLPD